MRPIIKPSVAIKLASIVILSLIQHLSGKGWDNTLINLISINLDRMNRYAMISLNSVCSF